MLKSKNSDKAGKQGTLPDSAEFVIRGGHVLTMDPRLGDLSCADVHVVDGEIAAVGEGLGRSGVPEIDARGMIVMPGLVDTHWHLWNSSLRALVRGDDPTCGYFPTTLKVGPLFSPEDSYRAVRLGLAEGIASGITTVNNWSHNTRSPQHADAELRAMHGMGIRGRFSYGWGQELPLDRMMDLEDLARVQQRGMPDSTLLTLGAAVRTPVDNPRGAVPIELVQAEMRAIRAMGLPITMHARPGVVSVLAAHDLLGPDLQLVHPQGISPEEARLVAAAGTTFSCSPVIEMHYAQAARGVIQFQELVEHRVQQSLSVDSSAASANADYFSCMRALLWSHKQRFGSNLPLTPRRLLELATIDGALDLGLDASIGSLCPGKRADIIMIRTADINVAPVIDPAHALVYSAQPANVDTVMVDGKVLLRHGRHTRVDVATVVQQAADSIRALRARCAEAA